MNIPNYPETDSLLDDLCGLDNIVMVDTARLARDAGNRRAQNMVCVGAASPLLDFEEDRLLAFVEMLFARKGGKIVTVNQHAFRLGRTAGLFFRGLTEAGVPKRAALDLVNKFDPDTIDPALVADWAGFVGDDPERLQAVLAESQAVACNRIPAAA